ncbi:hypothetical protein ASPZODRAFT_24938 [Penicilliopsis zonata CBS 506.65]|uniref:Major facilitator superfamily (MFS) profile domain-containing protein n=1 Tax=Penicilliopsis zonata CBS 506.65 TaxID=1073090 RepID=A0A1L9SIA5_9EURO|nr:hypothetical protein ASPZODRAFT_24938 [Penicilliopsis zonata CBS 506.65]OJJ46831.1 hypothetical protein ASPZODRAFT_24938 [Penicilliopsis zonata CBS 506.65]
MTVTSEYKAMDDESCVETLVTSRFLTGWRLHITTLALLINLYLVNLETTIVSTSLVTIADEMQAFNRTTWIVTGYLITYTGFIIIWSKLSDIIGRKIALLTTLAVFIAFSLGCGLAHTMETLIVCRAFQGIGSAGAYSLSFLVFYEMIPKSKMPLYGAFIAGVTALGLSTGPTFGGLLNEFGTWRWIFYLNLPAGGVAIVLLAISLPLEFGRSKNNNGFVLSDLRRIDLVGAVLLLSGSLLLVTALNEANVDYSWSSATIIVLLVFSAISWAALVFWEYLTTNSKTTRQEPVFPTRFFRQRNWMGMLLTTFLVGFPSTVVVVNLPERFQIVNGESSLDAGVRLLAYSATSAVAAGVASILSKKLRIPFVYTLFVGAALHTTGVACLSTLPTSSHFPGVGYFYEMLAGAGVGVTYGILVLATPYVVDERDLSVATGAIIQFRFLGGAIGLGIATNVLNGMLKSDLSGILTAEQLRVLLKDTEVIATLSSQTQEVVRHVFARSYNTQLRVMVGLAAAQIPAAALIWRKGNQWTCLEE